MMRRFFIFAWLLAGGFAATLAVAVDVHSEPINKGLLTAPVAVHALPPAECNEVRQALEDGVPIGPGFRRMEFEFPPNKMGIAGRLCRLMTMGSGEHIEGSNIRSISDMHAFIRGSLEQSGWFKTADTKAFEDRSRSGRDVFALFKNNALCISTIELGIINGYVPGTAVRDDKRLQLGALYPYERDWWITVDCFHF